MNVPPIPPPSVIETLILSKEFKGSKPFFSYLSLSILISKKATIFKKENKNKKKSSGCNSFLTRKK
jgi:hypothetical protein